MALSGSSVTRQIDATGDEIKTFTDGSGNEVQGFVDVDEAGTDVNIESWYASTAAENSHELKGSAGRLYTLRVINTSGSAVFMHIYDATGSPSGDPIWFGVVPANGELAESWAKGIPFSTGCVVGVSTTMGSYTAPGSNVGFFAAGYK